MKFDVVEPSDEQAVLGEEEAAEAEELPRGVHPKLAQASRRMRARVRDDLATLHASLGRLNEHVQIAQRRELDDAPAGPPPTNFRAAAFSRPGAR
ncbi:MULTISPECIES: hypothetical protein [Nocardiopsis]|uniref:Uncharacterized protein n=1 Tax=Nocardiopsis sinuspersici TaxID=501010 RepID=A0A1V3C7L2_9ACTN|nr:MULTISPECIES: hypothetical protein [Nocardiopsis]OOC56648.1 hypothetical protein NOSIN_24775 [Nocardiopsis sinuspersici]